MGELEDSIRRIEELEVIKGTHNAKSEATTDKPDINSKVAMDKLFEMHYHGEYFSEMYFAGLALGIDMSEKFPGWIEELKKQRANPAEREKATIDLRYMYKNVPELEEMRMAGEALGYSLYRISWREAIMWVGENKLLAASIAIFTAAVAGFVVNEYLRRQ